MNCDQKQFLQASQYGELNDLLHEWFSNARARGMVVSGSLLQEKALQLVKEMGHDGFSASNGWLQSWRSRFNVKAALLSGEAADVREEDVTNWMERLPTLYEGYEPCNIFNADKTGLFFRALPSCSLVNKTDSRKGGKQSKERIMVLLASSATGEKLQPLVIGKSTNPRCFRGIDKVLLGVRYEANRKAWMVSALFQNWLVSLDRKFRAAN